MSSSFNMSRAEIFARREGISFQEACSRIARLAAQRRRQRARQNACVNVTPAAPLPPKRRLWWQNDD